VTVDEDDEVNEYSVMKTYKEFFCSWCYIYDC